jgi:ATP-dependent helicase/nuclease subunit A
MQVLDFNDFEMLAYEALSSSPEWHNILYSFDEHTDQILVDEFQDTSTLQWKIRAKLTEEWRSGLGSKREAGGKPTIFLVGDEKQSIYMFRGANVSIFQDARKEFSQWLKDKYHFEEAKDNYRSLPAIVDFSNSIFSNLMPEEPVKSWITRYAPFEATRRGKGAVELLLLGAREGTKATRANEAEVLARKIGEMRGSHTVFDGGTERPARFSDMAVLLRKRTHLNIFEDALRREGIPFVMLKGIGFYDETETAVIRDFISFIVDPEDDYSLFCLLRSPLFSVDYKKILSLLRGKMPLIEKLRSSRGKKVLEIARKLDTWLQMSKSLPLAVLIERLFIETGGWVHFHEKQRHANIKKFITMVEALEADGLSPIEIREKLLRQRFASEVAKANINTEGMDAVRIMTIHASKGLQFPMVFLPSLDERISPVSGPAAIDEEDGSFFFSYEEDQSLRKKSEHFRRIKLKELEEEKRLFYVAVTRAQDYLCMLGSEKDDKFTGRLGYLSDAFGSFNDNPPLKITREESLPTRGKTPSIKLEAAERFIDAPSYTEPVSYIPGKIWTDATEGATVGEWHSKEGAAVGRVMHALFEEISRGVIREDDVEERAALLIREEATMSSDILNVILMDFEKMKRSGLFEEIVLPCKDSYAELPFVLEREEYVHRGRIDRIIIKDGTARLYDYKTFPAREKELPELKEIYRHQMDIYREATESLFSVPAESFLVFTHLPLVVPL